MGLRGGAHLFLAPTLSSYEFIGGMGVTGHPRTGGGFLGLLFVLVAASRAGAEGPGTMPAGIIELGVAGGYSVSFYDHPRGVETVYGTHGLLRLGRLMTDEHGSGLLRGNLELTLEPTYIHLDSQPSGNVYGAALLWRWLLVGTDSVRPYLEAGGGVIGGDVGPRVGNCEPNFILEGGPGVVFFLSARTAIDVGYRFHHISDASRCSPNLGVNSNMGVVGFSYFFQ
jgi:lipid A 3-O-deacylase